MQAATVHQMLEPDQDAMVTMVSHLFADQTCGLVELAWTNPMQGNPHQARLFCLDAIDELAAEAAKLNAERRNIYIGAALRKETTPPFGRTSAEDFGAATALWADLDDPGGAARAAELCHQLQARPTLVVWTGRTPHDRGQLWWRLDDPMRDAECVKNMLGSIRGKLCSDRAVVDPIRIMRLGGSIAWPVKDGRVAELTEAQLINGAHAYGIERLRAAFPENMRADNGSSSGPGREDFFGADVDALLAAIRAGDHWHDNMVRLTAHWIMRGWSDAEILTAAEALTLPGYTVDQTRSEAAAMIRGARQKWNKPNPAHNLTPEPAAPQNAGAIKPEKVVWRWYPYLPAAQLSLVAGYGGGGKGLVCTDFAARLTRGASWPLCEQSAPPAGVLWCEAEDPRAEVLVPRQIAAGADRNRIHFVNPTELAALDLRAFVQEHDVGLIVLSPLVSFLNGLKDVIGELGVRKTLEALQGAIDRTRCAAVGICHLNKKSDLPAVDRVLGSVAFVNFVRSVLLVAKDKELEGANRLVHGKYNLSVKGSDLLFEPRHVGDDPTDQFVKIEWTAPADDIDADKLFDGKKIESDSNALDWLVAYLEKFGETPSSVVIAAGETEGFSASALERARRRSKRCKTRKGGFGGAWLWWVE
jgi:hypothetical protein